MKLGVTFEQRDLVPVASEIPADYAYSLNLAAPGVTDIVSEQQSIGESWMDSLARLLPILAATEQQKKLLDVQAERARQGLPPLDVSQYSAGAKVAFSLDPGLQKMLVIGGAALLGILFLTRKG